MQNIRQRLDLAGLSSEATDLVMSSWRPATKKLYDTYVEKWRLYALSNNISVDNPSIVHVVNFLAHLFASGMSHSTIGSARSALSAYLPLFDGHELGSHPLVVRLMKGIFERKPSLPKYAFTWDVGQVLRYLKALPVSSELSFKLFTYRLVMLLSLLTAQRGQSIHLLVLKDIYLDPALTFCRISYSAKHKTTRQGFHAKPAEIAAYPDKKLCLVDHLHRYILSTNKLRSSDELLVTLQRPHKPIARATLSRWVKDVLKAAGIDTSIFSAHSTRSASTSAAWSMGASLDSILQAAAWSSSLTFARFYNRGSDKDNFSQAVYKAAKLS